MGTVPAGRVKPTRVVIMAGGLRGGGTEKFLRLFLRHVDRGVLEPVVVFVTGDASLDLAEARTVLDCPVHLVEWTRESSRLRSFLLLAALLRRLRPDVVYALQGVITYIGPAAARMAGVRTVVVGQRNMGHDNAGKPLRRRLRKFIYIHLVDGIIVNADMIRQTLERHAAIPGGRIRVVRNPVESEPAADGAAPPGEDTAAVPRSAEEWVTIVARLDRIKNHACFLRAAVRVAERRARARFLVVGRGPLEAELRELTARINLAERVAFLGHRDDVRQIVRKSSLVVLTSRDEGLPNCLLEALCEGTPVVATRVGGVPEVVKEPAWLVDSDDDRALADAILGVLADPDASRRRALALWREISPSHDPRATAAAQADALRAFHARGA